MNWVLLWIALYVLVQIGIGIWVSRYVRTSSDFMVGGRSLGPIVLSCAVFATFFGAEAIVGTAGTVYEKGLSGAQADPIGYAIALAVVGVLFAGRLRDKGFLTFADLFRQRYSARVEQLVVLVLLPGSLFWAAAQLRAFGQVVGAASGMAFEAVIVVGVVVVVIYTVLGGILADAWSDVLHSFVIVTGLLALLAATATASGGLGAGLAAVPQERFNVLALGDDGLSGFFERLAIPVFGTLVAVEVISLILSSKSVAAARQGCMAGAALYLVIGMLPVLIALLAPGILPGVEDSERIIPMIAAKLMGPTLHVLFIGAIVAAILSTVSTIFLASSSQVIHNLARAIRPGMTDSGRLFATRAVLVALAVTAALLALTSDKVKSLVEVASAAGSSGVFPIAAFALFSRFGGERAALAALVAGTAGWLILGKVLNLDTPFILAIALSTIVYIAVAAMEKRPIKAA